MTGTARASPATPAIDPDPPPGYPADFPYLPTHHGLTGQPVGWPSHELCEVITLAKAESAPTLRRQMRRAMIDAGWRIRRDQRRRILGGRTGFLLEGRRDRYEVLAIIEPQRRGTRLHIYDCGRLPP